MKHRPLDRNRSPRRSPDLPASPESAPRRGGPPDGAEPDLAFGLNPVTEALRAGIGVELLIAAGRDPEGGGRIDALASLAGENRVPVRRTDRDYLDKLTRGGNHQGAVCRLRPYAYAPFPGRAAEPGPRTVMLLDSVTDVGNFASMLRSFLALGVDLVVIPADRSVSVTPAVHRLSSGASLHLPVAQVTNFARAIAELKALGYFVYGACGEAGTPLPAVDFAERRAVVLGSEEKGVRPLVRRECDLLFAIPMTGRIESLNVAHAAAIVAYDLSTRGKA